MTSDEMDDATVIPDERNGADLLIETATALGVDTCFANPGTTELNLVDALGRAEGMRTVLALFEGVVSGAADGYARIAGRPALGVFHLGPGFANSLANQHNARRQSTSMINVIGDQASWHLKFDAPLSSDIDALTGWTGSTRRTTSADDCGPAMSDAFAAATSGNGAIANLIVPADHAWNPTTVTAAANATTTFNTFNTSNNTADAPGAALARRELAIAMLAKPGAAIIVGGPRVGERSLRILDAIRGRSGVPSTFRGWPGSNSATTFQISPSCPTSPNS